MRTFDKRFLTQFFVCFSFIALTFLLAANVTAQITTESGDDTEATGILPDMAFIAGGNLNISAQSRDDIFAAGGDVTISDTQADHLILAGGDVLITGSEFQDVIGVGGDFNFTSGTVADDIVAAGGDVMIGSDVTIGGSAVLSGGDVTLAAPVGGELRAAAGNISLSANVTGDARLVGDNVSIAPDVRIGGDLYYRADTFEMSPDATVAGEIIELEPVAEPELERVAMQAAAAMAVFALAFFIGIGILVIVIALLLPGLMNSASEMIRAKPLSTLGIGFLITVAAPVVIIVLFATVFGIPLALVTLALYIAAAPVAIAAAIYFLSMLIRDLITRNDTEPGAGARIAWSLPGVALFIILGLIPVVGGLVWLLAYVFGIGAVITRGGHALANA